MVCVLAEPIVTVGDFQPTGFIRLTSGLLSCYDRHAALRLVPDY